MKAGIDSYQLMFAHINWLTSPVICLLIFQLTGVFQGAPFFLCSHKTNSDTKRNITYYIFMILWYYEVGLVKKKIKVEHFLYLSKLSILFCIQFWRYPIRNHNLNLIHMLCEVSLLILARSCIKSGILKHKGLLKELKHTDQWTIHYPLCVITYSQSTKARKRKETGVIFSLKVILPPVYVCI